MAKTVDDYIAGLPAAQAAIVTALRRAILGVEGIAEAFKWGHPVYLAGGPVCLVKAYPNHVAFGFWRGAEMKPLDLRLAGGHATMATIKLRDVTEVDAEGFERLVAAGVALNREKGDPLRKGG